MKQNTSLTVSAVLVIVLFTGHLAHDFIFGLDSMTRAGTFTFLLITVVPLYAALELQGRKIGYGITLFVGLAALAMPVLHTVGGERSAGRGFFFVWTLLALGLVGAFSAILAARELSRSIRAARSAARV
jgi:hypothetical protein